MMNSGTVSRDSGGSYRQFFQRSSSPIQLKKNASERSQPGILIFSYVKKLLYINRRAMELAGHLDLTEIGPGTEIPLVSIQEFRLMIQQTLDQRKEAGNWEPFESEGTVFDVARKLLISGFGIANQESYDHSRIVIVLDEIGYQKKDRSRQAPASQANTLCAAP